MTLQQEKDYTQRFDLSLWRKLLRYAPRYKKHLIALAAFMGINALIDVAFPLLTSYAIDHLITDNGAAPTFFMSRAVEVVQAVLHCTPLTAFIVLYVLLVALSVATIYVFLYLGSVIEVGVCYEIRSQGFQSCRSCPSASTTACPWAT